MPHTEGAEGRRREAPPHRGSETPIRGCPAPRPSFDTGTAASLRCPDLVSTSALRSPHPQHPHPDRPPVSATRPPRPRRPHPNLVSASAPRPPPAPAGPASSKPPKADARSAGTLTSPGTAGVASRQRARISASPGFCQGYGAGAAGAASEPKAPRHQSAGQPRCQSVGSRVIPARGARAANATGDTRIANTAKECESRRLRTGISRPIGH